MEKMNRSPSECLPSTYLARIPRTQNTAYLDLEPAENSNIVSHVISRDDLHANLPQASFSFPVISHTTLCDAS